MQYVKNLILRSSILAVSNGLNWLMIGSMSRFLYWHIFVLLFTGMRIFCVVFNSGCSVSVEID